MRLLITLFVIGLIHTVTAQVGTGQWRLHVPSKNAHDVVAFNNRVYAAYVNGVSEYDFASGETTIWDAVNSLSDISVSCLGKYSNSLWIGYDNGNIDKISDNRVTNISAIKLAEIQGSKRINKLVENGNYIYAATGFSIIKLDPSKNEVRDTYYPTNGNDPILDIAFKNDSIYAITSDRLYKGKTSNIALADPTQWQVDSRVPVLTNNQYSEIEVAGNELFILYNDDAFGLDSVFRLEDQGIVSVVNELFTMEIKSINNVNDNLAVNFFDGTNIYKNDFTIEESILVYSASANVRPRKIARSDGHYWVADEENGLVKYASYGNSQEIAFPGPPKNSYYAMDWFQGKLVVAGGSLAGEAGTFNKSGIYIFEDEKWKLKDPANMTLWNTPLFWDAIAVSINPVNTDQIAVGSYSLVPLSLLSDAGQVTDTITPNNSILEWGSIGNGSSEVTDLRYDELGNLWILNGYSNKPLKVLTKDGEWYQFDLALGAKNKHSQKMAIDYNGNKWVSIKDAGLFGFKDNGTISSLGDDKTVRLTIGQNQGNLPSNQINAIAVDFDNEIWIGTDAGFAILYNSDAAFDAGAGDFDAQRIKIEFEGNVEYVLGATDITSIVVDGANRKWFGTASAGIVLMSADGLEILEQHTTDNSPLISNAIVDLELDQSTGELFIITDKGLVSYRTDATYEDPEYENVIVFPNPARPDFDGPITIQGIRYNSDVKITDVAGNLVYSTTSNGGTATWNGKTLNGEPVGTGVYLIWTAANEGKGKKVGKVLVVND
jgi:ligand-binding sensor domain-containing protein